MKQRILSIILITLFSIAAVGQVCTPKPKAAISASPASGLPPLTVYFTDASTPSASIKTWQWNFGDKDSTGSSIQYPAFTYSSNGVYHCSLIVGNDSGCLDTAYIKIIVGPVGTDELSVTVGPNPFASQTIISFNKVLANATLRVIDVIGRAVRNINFSGSQLVFESEGLQPGVYFIQLVLENIPIANQKILISD